jgi:large subunit ribosomal protein L25
MKTVELKASLRENIGKSEAKKQRKKGRVPGVMYGGEKEFHVTVDYKELEKIVFTPDRYFVTLNIDGNKYRTIIQDRQFHPVTDHIIHADFMEFTGKEPITMSIPVRTQGVAPGVMKGGNLFTKMRYIDIKALPDDMPEKVDIDISQLQINDAIHISDLPAEKIEYLAAPESTIVAVVAVKETALDEEEEEEEGEESEESEEKEEATEENAGGEE